MTFSDHIDRRILGAGALALSLALSLAATPPAAAEEHEDADWEVVYLDADGAEVRRHERVETRARVLGPRDTVMEVGCNANSENRYLRITRQGDREPQFAGELLEAQIEVFFGGKVIHAEQLDMQWREDNHYQARARARLGNALKDGIRVVVTDENQQIRLPFTLRGSYVAISAVPCD